MEGGGYEMRADPQGKAPTHPHARELAWPKLELRFACLRVRVRVRTMVSVAFFWLLENPAGQRATL